MELFSEVYGRYYQALYHVLRAAERALDRQALERIVAERGFGESRLHLLPRIMRGDWNLLEKTPDGYRSRIRPIERPLTYLEKAWLKSILRDERMRLFLEADDLRALEEALEDVRPLFYAEDFLYFDRFSDGDPYGDAIYRQNFKTILRALKAGESVWIAYETRRGYRGEGEYLPCRMIYSEKDDKFRVSVIPRGTRAGAPMATLNLARVQSAALAGNAEVRRLAGAARAKRFIRMEISKERNALERCMLHFSCYEKRTEYHEETGRYLCTIFYEAEDEPDVLIQVLSFGPVIRVTEPAAFVSQIRARVLRQADFTAGIKKILPLILRKDFFAVLMLIFIAGSLLTGRLFCEPRRRSCRTALFLPRSISRRRSFQCRLRRVRPERRCRCPFRRIRRRAPRSRE